MARCTLLQRATAVHVREIVEQIYGLAILLSEKASIPTDRRALIFCLYQVDIWL